MMRTSARGAYALACHEGIVPGPYRDSVGVWTYGIGHTAAAGDPIPVEMPRGMPSDLRRELRSLIGVFVRDLARYEAAVAAAIKVPVAQHEFDALVSFHYNTGAIGRASLVAALNAGDRERATSGFMAWVKPPEVTARRKAEQALFKMGTYPSKPIPVWGVTSSGRIVWKLAGQITEAEFITLLKGA